MRRVMQTLGAVGLVALIVPTAGADIALLDDGTRVSGQLTAGPEGRLRFLQSSKALAAQPQLIEFSPAILDQPDHARQRLWLSESQNVSGSLVKLTPDNVVFEVSAKDTRTISRSEVRALSRYAAHAVVVRDDFEATSKKWKLTGGAARSQAQAARGEWSLKLGKPAQSAELVLPESVAAGRVEFSFRTENTPRGAAWLMRATFGEDKTFTVLLAGTADGSDDAEAAPTTAGWHRLSLRFRHAYALVGIDRQLVWASADRQRFGPLRKLSLVCIARGEEPAGAVFIDDVAIAQSAPAFQPSPGIGATDALRMRSGDQLFGSLTAADQATLDFRGRFSPSSFSWAEVAGVELRAAAVPTHRTMGEHVRVRFFAADGSAPDELLGVVAALDDTALTLDHPVLGKVLIPRKRLVSIRPVFHGVRIELEHGSRYLGKVDTRVAGVPGLAEGPTLEKSFKVDAMPREVTLLVSVAHPGADGAAIENGRTDVMINGARVEALERHVRRGSAEYRRVRVALPADALRVGDNALELRLSAAPGAETLGHCLIRHIVLELSK
jgi:hypothetical protein